jgi:hypothetical protein
MTVQVTLLDMTKKIGTSPIHYKEPHNSRFVILYVYCNYHIKEDKTLAT